jgi:hypothetical protein
VGWKLGLKVIHNGKSCKRKRKLFKCGTYLLLYREIVSSCLQHNFKRIKTGLFLLKVRGNFLGGLKTSKFLRALKIEKCVPQFASNVFIVF